MIDRQTVFEIHRLHHLGWPLKEKLRAASAKPKTNGLKSILKPEPGKA